MTFRFGGKVQNYAVVAVLCAAAAIVALTATAGVAQSKSEGSIVLSTSVTVIGPHGKARVTAKLRPGSLGASGGTVTFVNETNHKTLGTAVLKTKSGGACTLRSRTCWARLSVSGRKLARGANRISGLFTPHRVYFQPLAGATELYRGVSPNCHAVSPKSTLPVFTASVAHAAADKGVCRGRVSNRSGTTQVIVSSHQRVVVTKHTVVAFGDQRLPCSTGHTGDLLAYSISGTRPPGSLAFRVFGRAARIAHRAHPNGYICYESTIPFKTASGTRAHHTASGLYYGSLPYCRDNDADDVFPPHPNGDDKRTHPRPCIEWERFQVIHGTALWTVWLEPSVGDPRFSH